jgi:hypothetical protein
MILSRKEFKILNKANTHILKGPIYVIRSILGCIIDSVSPNNNMIDRNNIINFFYPLVCIYIFTNFYLHLIYH